VPELAHTPHPHGEHRQEADCLGVVHIPRDALYGVNTVRGVDNLSVSRQAIGSEREFIRAFAQCKWAAALANHALAVIDAGQCRAIVQACREVADGMHDACMVVDFLEGSGGTSSNMNVNEVIANRAQQLLGGALGHYDRVHPNDHVNRSQSTNDVYPSAMKMAAYQLLAPLVEEAGALAASLQDKADAFKEILHLGRTCFQDAQPMMLGQVFGGYAALAKRLAEKLHAVRSELQTLPLGGTAIGTGFGAPRGYRTQVYAHLTQITGVAFRPAD